MTQAQLILASAYAAPRKPVTLPRVSIQEKKS